MATLRSKADCDLSVAPLGGRLVSPDELVEVDDETYQAHTWDPDTWDVIDAPEDPRTADELRAELKARGLATSGRKSELAQRLADNPAPAPQPGPVTPENGE